MKRAIVLISLFVIAGLALAASMELTSARLYKKQGEWEKSLDFYGQAISKDPANADAYYERGELLKDIAADPARAGMAKKIAGDVADPRIEVYKRMLADFQQAQSASNNDKKMAKKIDQVLQTEWGRYYSNAVGQDTLYDRAKAENKPDAGTHLDAALKDLAVAEMLLPDRWNTYGFRAQIYGKLDSTEGSATNWEQAINHITAADAEKQGTEEYKQGLAIARENLLVDCYNLGRRDCVLKQADAILATDPANVNAIQLKANTLAQMTADTSLSEAERNKMRQDAIAALEKARATDSTNADILYTIGQFHLQSGDTTAAMNAINESLKANPEDADALFLVGVLYLEGGTHVNTQKAADTFKKITEIDPNNAAAWTNWGVALIRLGKTEEGREKVEKAKSLGSK